MILFAFYITLIPLPKLKIQLFSVQLWVNSSVDMALQPRQQVEEKENSEFKPIKLHLKLTLCHILL